ncbi:MAG: hypothetical protein LBQ89_02170 [Treponema sp.]|jgi:hypothetical protein|nr:hypothetical protein [Treponema sp.]
MKTYKNIDEFIQEVLPLEYRKIIKRKKSQIEESIEEADAEFDEKLEKIIKGEKES